MKISVIIPTFKPQSYIFKCLDSLRKQTLDKGLFEVIVVLNGCDEPWRSQLQEYIDRHSSSMQMRFIRTDEAGVSNARNIALDCAKGEYIAFIDDDDYVSEAYLEELLKNSSPGCVALSDSLYLEDSTGRIISDNAHHNRFIVSQNSGGSSLFQSRVFFNGPCMKLLHRYIIGDRRFDVRFANGEDNLMMFLISDRITRVRYTSDSAVYYRRIRENSATTRERSAGEIAKVSGRIALQYLRYLARNPFGYNYPFALSRFAAEAKSVLVRLF